MHLRQADRADAITVEPFGEVDALVLRETVDGCTYLTRIYCWQGQVRELFAAEGGSFAPQDGECLMEAQALEIPDDDCE